MLGHQGDLENLAGLESLEILVSLVLQAPWESRVLLETLGRWDPQDHLEIQDYLGSLALKENLARKAHLDCLDLPALMDHLASVAYRGCLDCKAHQDLQDKEVHKVKGDKKARGATMANPDHLALWVLKDPQVFLETRGHRAILAKKVPLE